MKQFKNESIETIASTVAIQLNCSLLDAVSKMQGQCVKNGNEQLLEDLIEYKSTLIEDMFA